METSPTEPTLAARRQGADDYVTPSVLRAGVAIAVAGSVLGFMALAPFRERGTLLEILIQVLFLLPYVAAFVLCLAVVRRVGAPERAFWSTLAVSTGLILVSEIAASYVTVVTARSPVWLGISSVLTTAAAVLFIPLVFAMTRLAGTPTTTRIRFATDLSILGVFAYLILLATAVWPLYAAAGMEFADAVVATLYLVFGLLLITGVGMTVSPLKVGSWRVWERLVASGILVFGVGTALSPMWHLAADGKADALWLTLVEICWTGGYAFIAAGAAFRLADPNPAWRPRGTFVVGRGRMMWLPMALIGFSLISLPLLVAYAHRLLDANAPEAATVVTVAATVIGFLIGIRMAALGTEFGMLSTRAQSDPLTGLANHRTLHERLAHCLEVARESGESLSVIVLDIDGFRRVNAQLGHEGGDRLLREIAGRVGAAVGRDSTAGRPSGDEFVVVMPDTPASRARLVAEGLRAEVLAASAAAGLPLTASIGIATYPEHGSDADELLRHADGAQFWAKTSGRNRTVVYDPEIVVAIDIDERLGHLERESHTRTARALAAAVDARDPATQFHSVNVARLAGALARELGLEDSQVADVELAASLHDVGKIGVPDEVLFKPGKLTAADWRHVKTHPELGEGILRSTTMTSLLPWVRAHHERWDGSGYPDGLRAYEIPLEARILALCDAFDAMVSDRPYRSRMSSAAALQEIDHALGTQFDPAVGEMFIRMLSEPRPELFDSQS